MEVAVKVLDGIDWDQSVLDEFLQEVGIMASLRNPNILLCMGACTEEEYGQNNYAIVMEYMPRGDLHTLLHNANVPLSLPKKIQFAIDICKGMAWLAAQNILHRDLKPANVLIDKNWTCKICDFGLSQVRKSKEKKIQDHDEAPGSVLWMAPEVLLGEQIDGKLDVYAFALVFWEILTRKELFEEYDDKEVFTEDIARKGVRPALDGVHPVLQEILVNAWDRNPDKRPTFEQLLPKLEKALIKIYLPVELCPNAGPFWEKNFPAKARVPLEDFISKLSGELRSKNEVQAKCLRVLCNEEDGDEKVVSIERFSCILKWFGRMKDTTTLLERLEQVMQKPWFFGPEGSQKAEDRLKIHNQVGSFLIRLNMGGGTPIEKAPFSVSRIAEDRKVVHTRIYSRETGGLMIQPGSKDKIRTKKTSLTDLIDTVFRKEPHFLRQACPGWPYEDIFSKKPREECPYDEPPEDD
uniref:Protein kinase domain-containing protein n=1 Tax=Arcella intermedia TaxID=1963864 RepID=A0A6B2L2V6_9EUKA|eukprot:TRINITY_DN2789_c1_g3_i1.p1 TRINITY_DN2789_c1_g3~~TRINITY_DN2789_c1_g3_i1.p1  ORF type:complete len:543 (-),score=98.78 TRINITY_DN2789_c1_g3_i1:21-1415(-)